MIKSLRKADTLVHVEYLDGGYSSLHARDFTLEADAQRILFSFDFSPNERVRNKDSNCYHDVMELIEKSSHVKSFELPEETWLSPLCESMKRCPHASWELEVRFKSGATRKYHYSLDIAADNLIFVVTPRTVEGRSYCPC